MIGNVSPIHVIRPQLGLSDKSPIQFSVGTGKTAESSQRRVVNAQKTTLTDHKDQPWQSILYGLSKVKTDPKRVYFMTTEHVGIELTGEHADRFELVSEHVVENGRGIKLVGADGKAGLEGGSQPEFEPFKVRFRGAAKPGEYQAILRVVTQAGNAGTKSAGTAGEPLKELYYVDIPVAATVK